MKGLLEAATALKIKGERAINQTRCCADIRVCSGKAKN
jgi:hypothetical protein